MLAILLFVGGLVVSGILSFICSRDPVGTYAAAIIILPAWLIAAAAFVVGFGMIFWAGIRAVLSA